MNNNVLNDLLKLLWEKKLSITMMSGLFSLAVLLILIIAPKTYEATTVIRLQQLKDPLSAEVLDSSIYNRVAFVETHKNLMMGRKVLEKLIVAVPYLSEDEKSRKSDGELLLHRKEAILCDLEKTIKIVPRRFTDIINISVRDRNQKQVAIITNAFVDVYRCWLQVEDEKQYRMTSEFLKKQISRAEQDLLNASKALSTNSKSSGNLFHYNKTEEKIAKMGELENELVELESKLVYFDDLIKKTISNPQEVSAYAVLVDNNNVRELAKAFEQTDARLQLAGKHYKPLHPQYIELQKKMEIYQDKLQKSIVDTLSTEKLRVKGILAGKKYQMKRYEKYLLSPAGENQTWEKLHREYTNANQTYWQLRQKAEENKLKRDKKTLVELAIVSPAVEPIRHILPKRTKVFVLGSVLGLLLAIGVVVLREYSEF